MIERLHIQNYRSIAEATVELRPFTILVGANGSGKSNLLKLLGDLAVPRSLRQPHFRASSEVTRVDITAHGVDYHWQGGWQQADHPSEVADVRMFTIDPNAIGGSEQLTPSPVVFPNGQGSIQVLDALKTGDREDLFDTIEQQLRDFVPEIEKLSFVPGGNSKSLQVRERGIPTPIPLSELSEGTRLVLTILTIVHQERKPSIICFEDIDRGLHPALFGKVLDVCRSLVRGEGAPQILATTHNPYLVDQFVDDEDSVVIVEKKDANTTFTTLSARMKEKGLVRGDDTLGNIWYSGLVGGVPARPSSQVVTKAG